MTALTVAGAIADGSGPLTRRFACTRDALPPNGWRCETDQPMGWATDVPADAFAARALSFAGTHGWDSPVSAGRLLFGVVTLPCCMSGDWIVVYRSE